MMFKINNAYVEFIFSYEMNWETIAKEKERQRMPFMLYSQYYYTTTAISKYGILYLNVLIL